MRLSVILLLLLSVVSCTQDSESSDPFPTTNSPSTAMVATWVSSPDIRFFSPCPDEPEFLIPKGAVELTSEGYRFKLSSGRLCIWVDAQSLWQSGDFWYDDPVFPFKIRIDGQDISIYYQRGSEEVAYFEFNDEGTLTGVHGEGYELYCVKPDLEEKLHRVDLELVRSPEITYSCSLEMWIDD